MPRRKVRPSDVRAFLDDLDDRGAADVRRAPAGLDGRVEVSWREGDAVATRARRNAYLAERPWLGAAIVSVLGAVVAVVVVVLMVLASSAG